MVKTRWILGTKSFEVKPATKRQTIKEDITSSYFTNRDLICSLLFILTMSCFFYISGKYSKYSCRLFPLKFPGLLYRKIRPHFLLSSNHPQMLPKPAGKMPLH